MIAKKIYLYIKTKFKLRKKIKETLIKFNTEDSFILKQRKQFIHFENIKKHELFLNQSHKKKYLKLLYLSSPLKCNCLHEYEMLGNYTRHIRLSCPSCSSKKDFYFENGCFALENCISSFKVLC